MSMLRGWSHSAADTTIEAICLDNIDNDAIGGTTSKSNIVVLSEAELQTLSSPRETTYSPTIASTTTTILTNEVSPPNGVVTTTMMTNTIQSSPLTESNNINENNSTTNTMVDCADSISTNNTSSLSTTTTTQVTKSYWMNCLIDKENNVPLVSSSVGPPTPLSLGAGASSNHWRSASTRKSILERRGNLQDTFTNLRLTAETYYQQHHHHHHPNSNDNFKPSSRTNSAGGGGERQIRSMSHIESSTRNKSFTFDHVPSCTTDDGWDSRNKVSRKEQPVSDQTLSSSRSSQSCQSTATSTPSMDSYRTLRSSKHTTMTEELDQKEINSSTIKEHTYEWAYEVWRKKGLMGKPITVILPSTTYNMNQHVQLKLPEKRIIPPPTLPPPPQLALPFVTPRHSMDEHCSHNGSKQPDWRRKSLPAAVGPASAKKGVGRKSFANILQQWREKSDDKPNSHFLSPEQIFPPLLSCGSSSSSSNNIMVRLSQSNEESYTGPRSYELSSPVIVPCETKLVYETSFMKHVPPIMNYPNRSTVLEDSVNRLNTGKLSNIIPSTMVDTALPPSVGISQPSKSSLPVTTSFEPIQQTHQQVASTQSEVHDVEHLRPKQRLPSVYAHLMEFKSRAEDKAEQRRKAREEELSMKMRHAKSPPRSHADFRSAIQSQVDNVLKSARNLDDCTSSEINHDQKTITRRSKSLPRSIRRNVDQILEVKIPSTNEGASPSATNRRVYQRSQSDGGFLVDDMLPVECWDEQEQQQQQQPPPPRQQFEAWKKEETWANVSFENVTKVGESHSALVRTKPSVSVRLEDEEEEMKLPERVVLTRVKDLITPRSGQFTLNVGYNETDPATKDFITPITERVVVNVVENESDPLKKDLIVPKTERLFVDAVNSDTKDLVTPSVENPFVNVVHIEPDLVTNDLIAPNTKSPFGINAEDNKTDLVIKHRHTSNAERLFVNFIANETDLGAKNRNTSNTESLLDNVGDNKTGLLIKDLITPNTERLVVGAISNETDPMNKDLSKQSTGRLLVNVQENPTTLSIDPVKKNLITPNMALKSVNGGSEVYTVKETFSESSESASSTAMKFLQWPIRTTTTTADSSLASKELAVKDSPWTKRFVATLNEKVKIESEGISPRDQPSMERPWRRDMIIRKVESFSSDNSIRGNVTYDEDDNSECRCSNSVFSRKDEMIDFFLPQMGMACTCGKRRPGLMNPEEPTSLANILRPWQVEFLAVFGIYRGDQLVKAHHRSASHLSAALRQYRKKQGMKPFPTESCGMALQIWSKTSKAFVRSIRKQVTNGLRELKLPNTMYILSNFLDKLPSSSISDVRMTSVIGGVDGVDLSSQAEL